MYKWVRRQLDKIASPTLDWVQVEVTTYCNASCIYCPHTIMSSQWSKRHMPIGVLNELIPFLKHTDLIYLQGWGEPLLNNDFFEMVRICKGRGKRVGFTTNGTLLTEDTIRTLIDLQVDIIGISLAGTTSRTHNTIRAGTDFDAVMSSLIRLRKIKAERKTHLPAIHLAYLMLKSNFHELADTLTLAVEVGAKQIVASNLTLILDPRLSEEAIFNDPQRAPYYGSVLNEIKERAAREDVIFDYHGPRLDDASPRCRENVYQACVINVSGEVVPCVFTNPVLRYHYIFGGQRLPIGSISFGNIQNESLTHIWKKKEYAEFRDLFDPETARKPEKGRSKMPECCLRCYNRLGTQVRPQATRSEGTRVSDMAQALCWKSGQP